jgi:beta-glucanase (GH16 family)
MRLRSFLAVLPLLSVAGACGSSERRGYYQEDPNAPVRWTPGAWSVVWSDEFDGPAGDPPDATRWVHEVGGSGWGNKELQYYTDSTNNAALDGEGHLLITARAEEMMGNAYTSARLTTKGLFARAYGRFEARIRLPVGTGLWPAFWLMGDDFDEVGWPTAGEIDVMEENGHDPTTIRGTVHGPAYGKTDVPAGGAVTVRGGADTDFHVYAVEWDPTNIVFLVDGRPYFQVTPARRPTYARWVWDHPFFILLNLAVGGLFPGPPDETTMFPLTMQVDYVRVSERADGGVSDGPGGSDGGADDGAPGDDGPNDGPPSDGRLTDAPGSSDDASMATDAPDPDAEPVPDGGADGPSF